MGVGGSIPFIAEFLQMFPGASILVTGVEDPDTRAHGPNEGLHLPEFERAVVAEALLLQRLGEPVLRRDRAVPMASPLSPCRCPDVVAGRVGAPCVEVAAKPGERGMGVAVPPDQ